MVQLRKQQYMLYAEQIVFVNVLLH